LYRPHANVETIRIFLDAKDDPMKVIKKFRLLITMTLLFTVLWLLAISLTLNDYRQEQRLFLEGELKDIDSRIDSVVMTYDAFTDFILDGIIAYPEITRLMKDAGQGDEILKASSRNTLYEMLQGTYASLEDHGFRQLHFHLPDGESFLRFHSPDTYGDSLFEVRESVRLVNTTLKKVVGFEEGRIFSGYRFVFPLFCEDSHVGSVEISIGMDTALALLEEMNPDLNVFYLLDKDVVLSKVFDDQLDHYLPAFDFEDYLIDKAMFEKIIADEAQYGTLSHPELMNQIGDVLGNENRTAESLLVNVDAVPHQVHLIPLDNVFDDTVGYFIAIKEASRETLISQRPIRELILYTVIYLLLLTFASVFIRDKLRLEELASKDQLTDVFNRHKLTELGQRELLRSKRTGGSVSALILDIDHFKAVNDTFGHAQGDAVLKSLGKTLKETLRGVDIFGRWGGEEFLIIAPDTTAPEARIAAERLREAVAALENPITVSIGIATTARGEADLDLLVQRADEALYTAKETGRNKVVTWPAQQ